MSNEEMKKPKVNTKAVREIYTAGNGSDYWGMTLADLRKVVLAADEAEMRDDALVSTTTLRKHHSIEGEQFIQNLIVREETPE